MSDFGRFLDAVAEGNLAYVSDALAADGSLIASRDERGATALHYAALHGQKGIALALIEHGAAVNALDEEFGATPAGWAIEYLRERGAFLAVELDDLAYAIQHRDIGWISRFLARFPALRLAADRSGTPFRQLARESGNEDLARLFDRQTGTDGRPRSTV